VILASMFYVYAICYMFFYVCNFVIFAAACLDQDTLGKEIFNLNEFFFWLNKGIILTSQ